MRFSLPSIKFSLRECARSLLPLLLILLALPLLLGAKGCSDSEQCKAAKEAERAICGAAPESPSCQAARQAVADLCKQAECPAPPDGVKVCEGGDPSKWCGCWTCSARGNYTPTVMQACPDCRTTGCPPGQHCRVENVHGTGESGAPGWASSMASCVPDPPPPAPTCVTTPCAPGYHCQEQATGPVCVPDPMPPEQPAMKFPVRFPKVGVRVYSNNHKYGNGLDGTPRIGSSGDPELCEALHHVPVPRGDCHFDSDVWRGDSVLRGRYEMWVLAGARDGQPLPAAPLGLVWEYKSGPERGRCHDDRVSAAVSCDHFGNAATRDDPNTPAFEGLPAELGAQRDAYGPYAGFFTMPQCPHTPADFGPDGRLLSSAPECSVRSCPPLAEEEDSACGPWTLVDWR